MGKTKEEETIFISITERSSSDLLELVCQLHFRALQYQNKEVHDAYVEARTELESRLTSQAAAKVQSCDAMGHYGGEKPEGICPKCGKPWKDERQKDRKNCPYYNEKYTDNQCERDDCTCLVFGVKSLSPESGEQDEVVRFAEMCIVFGLKFDGLRQEWKDGTGRVVTRKIIYDFIKPKL